MGRIDSSSFKYMLRFIPDKIYIQIYYFLKFGKKCNLKNPQTFNEKLQWLKLHDRNPDYTKMVDKYEAKKYIAEKIGKKYVIPTLGIWDHFDDIDFNTLPEQFVLKCTHDSGGLVICKDKNSLDFDVARKKLETSLKRNFYYIGREWPYKNVKPRIIAEEYIADECGYELRDYKFFCFDGVCKCMKVDFDRFVKHHANYYDLQGNLLDLGETKCPPDRDKEIILPSTKKHMIEFAEELSKDIPFLRVDFYDVNGKIFFGELTFFPASGFGRFTKDEWDYRLGKWIILKETENVKC